jgi:hypothetical protein
MKRLKNLDVDEVSLVDIGANKKKFLIFKNKSGEHSMSKTESNFSKIAKALKIKKDAEGDKEKPVMKEDAAGLSEGAQAALKAVERILMPFKSEVSDNDLDAILSKLGISVDGGAAPVEMNKEAEAPIEMEKEKEDGMEAMMKEFALPASVKEEHAAEALSKAKDAMSEHLEKLGYQKYPSPEMTEKMKKEKDDKEEMAKDKEGDKEEMEKSVQKAKDADLIFKAHKELIQKNLDLQKKIDTMSEDTVKKEIVQKAASFNIGLNQSDLVEVLTQARKVSPAHYEKVCKQFETLGSQNKTSSLFMELGSSMANSAAGVEAKIDAAVDAIVKKSSGVSKEKAYSDFMETEEGRKLYAEMKKERPNGI